jgi:hypothetical protein
MGTVVGKEQVELAHNLQAYLRGVYQKRSRSFKRSTKRELPIGFERILYLKGIHVEGESRDPFTVVTVSGVDNDDLVYGVGFAKRSFDQPRLERGTSIALSRAIDDLIRKMALNLFGGNGNES